MLASSDGTAPTLNSGYEVLSQLGVGSDGTALLARDRSSNERVLLYFLTRLDGESPRWRAVRERLQALALLEHPAVLRVLDIDEFGSSPRVVLEWAGEHTLGEVLTRGPMALPDVVELATRAAQALAAAHKLGLHHGSLGPYGVYLGEGNVPGIDLTGLAVCSVAPGLDAVSAAYAPPEWGREPTGPDSDVWALGALMLALTLGRHPSAGELARAGILVAEPVGRLLESMLETDRDARPEMPEVARVLLQSSGRSQRTSMIPGRSEGVDAAAPPAAREGGRLGRYQLLRKLGEGGMGSVFEGMDLATGATVAVKVLHHELSVDAGLLKRFRREGRMLAEVRSPYVANLLELNEEGGLHYLAMEYVAGPTLAQYQEKRGRIDERTALELGAELCRALEGAHRRGIVHRDMKPENVMLTADELLPAGQGPRVKLCDFGIARDATEVRKTGESTRLTTDGAVVGTPMFMAPEQCKGAAITPATDIYSLGITLFLLLAGRPPFESEQPMELMVMHASKAPPVLSELVPGISEPTSALIARTLEKEPSARYADAAALLDAIERVLRGEPGAIALHPLLPATRAGQTVTLQWHWDLASAPESLWPLVADTDQLNRSLGNPPPDYRLSRSTMGNTVRHARFALRGIPMSWTELPYEWVEGRRWGVYRVYDKGPMKWLSTELELTPRPEGGTRLSWTFRFDPRNAFFKLVTRLEMSLFTRRKLGKLFAGLDRAVAQVGGGVTTASEVFAAGFRLTERGETLLQGHAEKLRAAGVSERVVDALRALVRHGSDAELGRMRPIALAQRLGLDEGELVEACLRGAHSGLLVMLWDVLCPLCRVPASFAETLAAIEDHAHCEACAMDYRVDFARSIELFFRVAPSVRSVETKVFCAAGPYHAPHVVAQVRLAPGERFVLSTTLEPGRYRLRSLQLTHAVDLRVSKNARLSRLELPVGAALAQYREVLELADGAQQLGLTSELDTEVVMRLERQASRDDALTAARAAGLALFRELFPGEVLKAGELVSVANVTLLTTALPEARELLRTRGDAAGFELILRHFRLLNECIDEEGGQLLKTVGAGVVAAFEDPLRAVRAAMLMHARLRKSPETAALALRVAVHQGPAVAATLNNRVDYFGHHAELAMALPEVAGVAAVVLSRSVAEDLDVAVRVWGAGLQPRVVSLEHWEPELWAAVIDASTLRLRSTSGA